MKTLVAKPVVKGRYWLVIDGDKKVGNVQQTGTGYDVKLHGQSKHFSSTKIIQTRENIVFQPAQKREEKELTFAVYPTTPKVFNSMFDVKRKLHLFTKTRKSKCYFVAGWFKMDQGVVFCPKFIFVQRYDYTGPYKTKTEAEAA